jgi:parvulin-like peptidyl-prolyl isomerase
MLTESNDKELLAVPRKLSEWIRGGRRSLRIALIILGLHFVDAPVLRPEIIDRLVAVVNRQIITLGDVEQELRFQRLDAEDVVGTGSEQKQNVTQESVVQHLIEQTLIREQIQQFPGLEIEDEQVDTQLAAIEKKIGGKEKLAEMKIDLQTLKDRLRWQLQVMKFVDYRFRQFVVVDSKEIEAYYQNQFLPELGRRSGSAQPELNEVEEPIRKILTEEKVNTEVEEWLASLRKDATIEIFH